jgi:glycosyltransferase involved in cell wall biosynthesis
VLAEASACGIPSVTTDVGEARAILGEAGHIVPVNDTDALAESLIQLATVSASVRREIGQSARERIGRQFSLAEMLGKYRQLYQQLSSRERESGDQLINAR